MSNLFKIIILNFTVLFMLSCTNNQKPTNQLTAKDILGNPDYQAISYSGYRGLTRDIQPSIEQLKEDMLILAAIDIKLIRTYNLYLAAVPNLLKAISELKAENPDFEMYVMLGAWMDCLNAWTELPPDHTKESKQNAEEIERAIKYANQYPDIVKIIAVGNEAMIRWAESYYVQPGVILKWVKYLQAKKQSGELPETLWITSSDNFASWGGGDSSYHTEELNELIKAVDFISMHTYAMHDTHYNPEFWGTSEEEDSLPELEKIELAMQRAANYSISQYESVVSYMQSLGVEKPVHIGETGWATIATDNYGLEGSKATDEYKSALYYQHMREWTNENNISCFFFEAFDEPWKDAINPQGSENHFGLINIKAQAKFALWDMVDAGTFEGLTRDGQKITKTYNGSLDSLLKDVALPPLREVVEPEVKK
jgi:exo-beta-1,3-glucanase (GH17 family)